MKYSIKVIMLGFLIPCLWVAGLITLSAQEVAEREMVDREWDVTTWQTVPPLPTYTEESVGEWEVPKVEVVAPAIITKQAVRGDQTQVTPTVPPPEPVGVHGLPFAPDDLSGCDEMMWYAYQFGLPARFEGVGWRESRCRNDVNTWCCYGYWQLYVSLHLEDHRLGPMYAECDITSIEDIFGNEPIQKQRNACGARAVYDVQGGSAWDAW